jgi:hypothetical protein
MTNPEPKPCEKEGAKFHMMVGYCIATWADVDDGLFRIFRHCVGPIQQSAIIYYKTPGLEARFTLTDEIVRSVLPKPKKKSGGHDHPSVAAWTKTIKGYGDLLSIRRRIAHHPIAIRTDPNLYTSLFNQLQFGKVTMGSSVPPLSWFEIYVTQHEKLRANSADLAGLRIEDLQSHLEKVGALGSRLLSFFIDVLSKHVE